MLFLLIKNSKQHKQHYSCSTSFFTFMFRLESIISFNCILELFISVRYNIATPTFNILDLDSYYLVFKYIYNDCLCWVIWFLAWLFGVVFIVPIILVPIQCEIFFYRKGLVNDNNSLYSSVTCYLLYIIQSICISTLL